MTPHHETPPKEGLLPASPRALLAIGDWAKNLARRRIWLVRAAAWMGAYALWVAVFRLLVLSLVTYFLTSSAGATGHSPRFEDITEAFGANEITLMGLAALVFVVMLRAFNPLTSTTTHEIFTPQRFERRFLPGFLHGSVLAVGVILAFLISGTYRYLGVFIQFEEAPLALLSVVVRILALGALAYCEEFIFRHKILKHLRAGRPERARGTFAGDLSAAALVGVCYCLIKMLQFELGVMHVITLFLLSMALAIRTLTDHDFTRGAGFWAALLIVFHPLLSLPVLGNDFSGILLVKYQSVTASGGLAAGAPGIEDAHGATARFFTGGAGGPISSLAFQLLLVFDIARGALRHWRGGVKISTLKV